MKRAVALSPAPVRSDDAPLLLPHNLEAERATLGAAMLSDVAADHLVDHLIPDDYFRRAHQVIFTSIRELRHRGSAIDLTTLRAEMGPKATDIAGGPSYLSSLVDGVPRSSNVAHYAQILRDLHARRSLMRYANATLDLVASGEHSSEQLLLDADRRLLDLQKGHNGGRLISLKDAAPSLWENLEWRQANRGKLTGVDTGFDSINNETLGWQGGDLIVVAARPSIGKTTFVMNAAVAACRGGAKGAVFSMEMRLIQLQNRMLSSLSGVPLSRILSGHMMEVDWKNISDAYQVMNDLDLVVDDTSGQSAWDIRSACRRMKAERGLDFVIIDYVQLMAGSLDRKGATRNDEVTDISRRLKVLADEISCPILLLSQLSRASEKRPDPRPKLSDLRESGALEQDADVVAFLHRRHHREGGCTNFIIEKARNGPTGTVNLTLDRDIVTFTDGGEEPPAPPREVKEKKPRRYASPGAPRLPATES